MKLLSFQPFSLKSNSGGGRILRRLYQGHETQIVSLGISTMLTKRVRKSHTVNTKSAGSPEFLVPAYPLSKPWQRWYARDLTNWLREKALRPVTIRNIQRVAASLNYDVVHTIDHFSFSAALCDGKIRKDKPLWVSFHDHFSTTKSSFESTKKLWQTADRRLCISNEIGLEYQKLFGNKDFEIITDGVKPEEISEPKLESSDPVVIYFAGMLHMDYFPLFQVLADALDILTKQGYALNLVLRGAHKMNFLENRSFPVEYRPVIIDDRVLKEELDLASILYLPMYFTVPEFYLYSLSTKMVGYLAAPGSILYHGPSDSAACVLLEKHKSAVSCNSLNAEDMVEAIKKMLLSYSEVSKNAKVLAKSQFSLETIKNRFWQNH